MPEVSRFYGIKIRMFFDEKHGPHFHARYGENMAQVSILTLAVLRGKLAPNAERLVLQWAHQYQRELLENWERARRGQALVWIPGLDE
jgi:hypothetical protein